MKRSSEKYRTLCEMTSIKTQKLKNQAVNNFITWCHKNTKRTVPTQRILNKYVDYMLENKWSKNTIKQRLSHIKVFAEYVHDVKLLTKVKLQGAEEGKLHNVMSFKKV